MVTLPMVAFQVTFFLRMVTALPMFIATLLVATLRNPAFAGEEPVPLLNRRRGAHNPLVWHGRGANRP